MQDTFEMLEELLEQEQFELLFPKENGAQAEWEWYETYENNERKQGEKDSLARVGKEKNPGDIRLVYLMNDAVESFLIFRDARLTGSYLENYEGPLKSSLSQEGDEYILVVWQGENVVTLFFRMLDLEAYLYNYGEIGHFWVPGYEYLRQLEYRIAIARDKLGYLGVLYRKRKGTCAAGGLSTVELLLLSCSAETVYCAKGRPLEAVCSSISSNGRASKRSSGFFSASVIACL